MAFFPKPSGLVNYLILGNLRFKWKAFQSQNHMREFRGFKRNYG